MSTEALVDAYIAALPAQVQVALGDIRQALREAMPDAEEGISYQIPALRQHGRWVIYFAGYTGHTAVYPVSAAVLAALGEELEPYRSGKATLRFPLGPAVPVDLIRRVGAIRAAEMADRKA